MAFGAAHMDLSAIIGGTRAILGNHPVSNMPEVMPGSVEQATEIVENFKKRREIDIEPTNLWWYEPQKLNTKLSKLKPASEIYFI